MKKYRTKSGKVEEKLPGINATVSPSEKVQIAMAGGADTLKDVQTILGQEGKRNNLKGQGAKHLVSFYEGMGGQDDPDEPGQSEPDTFGGVEVGPNFADPDAESGIYAPGVATVPFETAKEHNARRGREFAAIEDARISTRNLRDANDWSSGLQGIGSLLSGNLLGVAKAGLSWALTEAYLTPSQSDMSAGRWADLYSDIPKSTLSPDDGGVETPACPKGSTKSASGICLPITSNNTTLAVVNEKDTRATRGQLRSRATRRA